MRPVFLFLPAILLFSQCNRPPDREGIKAEIFRTEKAFEKMTAEKGAANAFYYFADENAVILRENDTLIAGRENIRNYYARKDLSRAMVSWTPDFIEVSVCGTLGYTYGKYEWKIMNSEGDTLRYKGIFHTVWKKQEDNTWKYVWD